MIETFIKTIFDWQSLKDLARDMTDMPLMWEVVKLLVSDPVLYQYLAIPVSSAIIGWGTNVVAIKMMFYPIEPIGKPPFLGWQGIVPAKAQKMAGLAINLVMTRLLSMQEVFNRIDANRIAEEMDERVKAQVEPIIEDTMTEFMPIIWETIPRLLKKYVYTTTRKKTQSLVANIMGDIKLHVEEVYNIQEHVFKSLENNKTLMNTMFLRFGGKEFKFVERSGLYFGFLFGIPTMVTWGFWKPWWLLPLGGLAVGYMTNWIALKMVFEPVEPIRIGPYVHQGLFLKRQKEVAHEYARMVTENFFKPEMIFAEMLTGTHREKLFHIFQHHVKKFLDEHLGAAKTFLQVALGTREFIELKHRISEKVFDEANDALKCAYPYVAETLDLESTIRSKMTELPAQEFIGILRPPFKEDEWMLITVGALLGLAAGFFQLFYLFSEAIF